jgi:hypothetical protein
MAKKKVETKDTVTVRKYDDVVQDYYTVEVKKEPVSACVLCGCAGCLSAQCCEHLEFWSAEHGRPARYQISQLMDRIVRLEELIAELDKTRKDAAQAMQIAVKAYSNSPYTPPEVSLLKVLVGFLSDDITGRRTLVRKDEDLCDSCGCSKCNARMLGAMRNDRSWEGFKPLPECCGHKDYQPSGLPF